MSATVRSVCTEWIKSSTAGESVATIDTENASSSSKQRRSTRVSVDARNGTRGAWRDDAKKKRVPRTNAYFF